MPGEVLWEWERKSDESPKQRLAKRQNLREFRGLVTRRVKLVIEIGRKHPTFQLKACCTGFAILKPVHGMGFGR